MSLDVTKWAPVFGAFLITASIVNDAVIVSAYPFFTWAKVLFIAGCLMLSFGKLDVSAMSKLEFMLVLYAASLMLFTALFSGGGIGDRFFSLSTSLVIGVASFMIITRSDVTYGLLVKVFCWWVSLSVVLGLIQAASGTFYVSDRIFKSTVLPGTFRASGLMSDPNYFALVCLIGFCFSKTIRGRTSMIFAIACGAGLVISGSRAGLLVAVLMLVLFRFENLLSFRKILYSFVGLAVTILALYWARDVMPESLAMIFDASSYDEELGRNSLSDRLAAITAGVASFFDNPLFGYGLGNLVQHPDNHHGQMSHNTLIEILAENGLVGLVLYVGLWLVIIHRLRSIGVVYPFFLRKVDALTIAAIVFWLMSFTLVVHYSRILFFLLAVLYRLPDVIRQPGYLQPLQHKRVHNATVYNS